MLSKYHFEYTSEQEAWAHCPKDAYEARVIRVGTIWVLTYWLPRD